MRLARQGMSRRLKVLFICTHNSARSQMAEGFLGQYAGDIVEACSAGTEPGELHPLAVRTMAEVGIDISSHRAKPLDGFLDETCDYAITVCDDANESCPVFPNTRHRLHWSFPDPCRVQGTLEERLAAFRSVRDAVRAHVEQFLKSIPDKGGRLP